MKNSIVILLLLICISPCFSQIDHLQILLGKTESQVRHYLDSLNSLKKNPYYKIEKDISQDGNLILKSGFSISDEQFYTCTSIWTFFNRIQGTEICVNQRFLGGVEYAQSNLSFIKDNFEFVSEGRWQKPFGNSKKNKIVATFKRNDGEFPTYVIDYFFEPVE